MATATLGELLTFAIGTFVAIFAIVNPIGATTFFVALTKGYTKKLRRRVVDKAVLAATLTLVLFAFLGNYIFAFFGTSIPAFRIAGGILLFGVAFSMIQGERPKSQLTPQDQKDALEKEAVGIVPLGIPMLAGPGAITTVMVLMAEASAPVDPVKVAIIVVDVLVTMAITFAMLSRADWIFKRIGRMGAYAFARVMGIILAAVAVQFVILGIRGALDLYFR
ncbi:MAG: NAAT family transporter [Methanobacteriota archaeon]|nr:MAG: NAAT family transporter [Euryarchaeota archaeon]